MALSAGGFIANGWSQGLFCRSWGCATAVGWEEEDEEEEEESSLWCRDSRAAAAGESHEQPWLSVSSSAWGCLGGRWWRRERVVGDGVLLNSA